MAKYIKREMADLNGKGETQAYYHMQIFRNMDSEEFLQSCAHHSGLQRSTLTAALTAIADELAWRLADSYSVTLEGLGTFKARLGVRPDKEQDGFSEDEQHRNMRTLEVNGINFKADKELVWTTDRRCRLERGGESRLRPSKYSPEQRRNMAVDYLRAHALMRVADYMALTGLARTAATNELRRLSLTPGSGIGASGQRSSKVYVLKEENQVEG